MAGSGTKRNAGSGGAIIGIVIRRWTRWAVCRRRVTRRKSLRSRAMQVSEAITRKSASNLALAFVLLPREKRQEMAALYAFCREVDDVADDESAPVEVRSAKLQAWRTDVKKDRKSVV